MEDSFSSAFRKAPETERPDSFSSAFREKKETPDSSIARDIGSLTTGAVGATPYGIAAGGLQAFGIGEALSERDELAERIPELMEKFPTAPWKEEWKQGGYDPEQFKKEYDVGLKAASETFPSVGNIAKWVEKATGLPFTPQTPFQHLLSFLGGAAKISPGNMGEKAVRTAAAGATREALIQGGLPEPVADTFAYATLFAKKDQIGANLIKKEKETAAQKAFEERKRFFEGEPPSEPPGGGSVPPSQSPSSGTPPPGTSPNIAAEEGKITAPEQYLKSDYEIAEDIKRAVSPLTIQIEQPTNVPVAREANALLSPVEKELNQIAPHRVNNPRLLGAESARTVQRVSNQIYQGVNQEWNNFRSMASDISHRRENLVHDLGAIIEEHGVPQTQTSAKVLSLAQSLRRRARRQPLSNEELADAIIEARKGFKYNIHGGQESHRINEYIRAIENEMATTMSPAEAAAYAAANQAYSDWAQVFKNKQIMPYRYTDISSPRSLYQKALKPDTLQKLIPILEQDPTGRGRSLSDLLKRNLLENYLSPYLTNLKGINPFRFQKQMGEMNGIIDEKILQEIEQSVANAHLQSRIAPSEVSTGYKSKFLDMNENQISSYLDKVSGLKELEHELLKVPGGKEIFDNVKKTKGIDLLFGGQMDIPSRSTNLSKYLNDRNGQYYIKYTLGDKVFEELKQLERAGKIESTLKRIEQNPELYDMATDPDILIKGGEVLVSILKGNAFSAIKKGWRLAKTISKAQQGEKALSGESYFIE
jgi:hypothetical protein